MRRTKEAWGRIPGNRWGATVLGLVAAVVVLGGAQAAQDQIPGPLREIARAFPGSLTITLERARTIEFCPDNTCDLFVGESSVSEKDLADFAFLYLWYFSDYFTLEEWRTQAEPAEMARRILAQPAFQGCGISGDEGAIRCAVRALAQGERIHLYAVRYDEKVRVVDRIPLDRALTVLRSGTKRP